MSRRRRPVIAARKSVKAGRWVHDLLMKSKSTFGFYSPLVLLIFILLTARLS